MSPRRRCNLALAAFTSIGVWASPSLADDPFYAARAQKLFDDAKRLRDEGRIEEACAQFARSKELSPGIGVTLSLADCHLRLGRTDAARTEFLEAEKLAHAKHDPREGVAHARVLALDAVASDNDGSHGGPADALFEEGVTLRKSGKVAEACAKFAQSEAMAPGTGIALHLGDCYEKVGRTASAWIEFSAAEKMAHERGDKREATARAHASALAAKVPRLTLVVPASAEPGLLQLDGRTVPPSFWNVALATDPGDHVVTFEVAGERRTLPVHLDDTVLTLSVKVEAPEPAGVPATPSAEGSAASTPPADRSVTTLRWAEIGLLGGAVVAAGVGAGLLVVKNDSMSNGTRTSRTYVDPVAAAASKVSFAVAGAAAGAAIVLYLSEPRAKSAGLYVGPASVAGGAGALFGGAF